MSHIELDDAQLASVVIDAGRVMLQLASAPAWRPGEGADARRVPGHLCAITLRFDTAVVQFDAGCAAGDCIGAVREARLRRNGQWVRDLRVPVDWTGAIALELVLRNGAGLQVQAQRLQLTLADDSRFIDSMVC